ncbi:MAG: hypothetical protein M1818_001695 [Claussenomyces sp. TS43310]|nr:MAG: hypothetical protein M1818_001695 [Claussenomyces sp. TS43310]
MGLVPDAPRRELLCILGQDFDMILHSTKKVNRSPTTTASGRSQMVRLDLKDRLEKPFESTVTADQTPNGCTEPAITSLWRRIDRRHDMTHLDTWSTLCQVPIIRSSGKFDGALGPLGLRIERLFVKRAESTHALLQLEEAAAKQSSVTAASDVFARDTMHEGPLQVLKRISPRPLFKYLTIRIACNLLFRKILHKRPHGATSYDRPLAQVDGEKVTRIKRDGLIVDRGQTEWKSGPTVHCLLIDLFGLYCDHNACPNRTEANPKELARVSNAARRAK